MTGCLLQEVRRDRTRRRLLKDDGRRQCNARERAQPRRELRRSERVNARLHERRLGGKGGCGRAGELAHHAQYGRLDVCTALRWTEARERVRECVASGGGGDRDDMTNDARSE